MKAAVAVFLVQQTFLLIVARADEVVDLNQRDFRTVEESGALTYGPLSHGNELRLVGVGDESVFLDQDGKEVHRLDSSEQIVAFVHSPKGGSVLFHLLKETEDGLDYEYSSLLVIKSTREGVVASEVLKAGDPAVSKSLWRVGELGAVSEDGMYILLELVVERRTGGVAIYDYSWQTWQATPPVRRGIGLRVENGITESGEQGGAGQPATAPYPKPEGNENAEPESEGRSR